MIDQARYLSGNRSVAERQEWLGTNGRGGVACGAGAGLLDAGYPGLVIAAPHPPLGPTPADGEFFAEPTFRWLRRELPNAAQVVCCSPLTDDEVVRVLRYLSAYGHAVTVVSPEPGTPPTAAGTATAARRLFRCSALRRERIPVVDWRHDESLAAAIERQRGAWSA